MKKSIILYLIIIWFSSCSSEPNIIYYRYNDQIVTRFNDYPKDYFLLGKHISFNDTINNTFIKTSFSGFDGLMDGYLIFNKNKTVDMIGVDANFEKFGDNDSINLIEFENNGRFNIWEEKTRNNFSNIIRLSDVIKTEKRLNKERNSKIIADYGNLKTE